MLGERVLSQSEVIRAILFEDSPCCCGRSLNRQYELAFQMFDSCITDTHLTPEEKQIFDQLEILGQVPDPTTWTTLQHDGPNHLGLW